MQVRRVVDVFNGAGDDATIERHLQEIKDAVGGVHWPPDTSKFILRPVHLGNGVVPIKQAFQELLERRGWGLEVRVFPRGGPGKMDAAKLTDAVRTVVEWETGNISSSHRALNKMTLAIKDGIAKQGVLVMPTRDTSYYLTDRIGNFEELEPYLPVLRRAEFPGRLLVVVVAHDALDETVPLIGKGTDGRALI